ncbi:rhomboid family-domain-containing protein [Phakopsora pachyrhizi]|nr:rhomboid family-domain-containing protein [Phakopsora pachyrhizi]
MNIQDNSPLSSYQSSDPPLNNPGDYYHQQDSFDFYPQQTKPIINQNQNLHDGYDPNIHLVKDDYRDDDDYYRNNLHQLDLEDDDRTRIATPLNNSRLTTGDLEDQESKPGSHYPPSNFKPYNHTNTNTNTNTNLFQHTQPSLINRPPVWMRMIWDRTHLDQKILNHQRGIGVQNRAYVCMLLSLGMLIALILELTTNYQGTPISTKPTFNYMIGPSSMVLINVGARFTPCIKFVANVSDIPFPCLNTTTVESSCMISMDELCGFGGFAKPNEPDQKFRSILPLFLHAGLVHYALNIYVQLTSSALIERQMGSIRFLMLYIPSGVFGFILGGNFSLVGQPSVGASGAIFSTYAAILVDLIAHWSIEHRAGRKLVFLLLEIVSGLLLGLIPGIDNFSHIGGFSMGLLLSIILFPVLHQSKTHQLSFYLIRLIALVGSLVMFIVLYLNFFKEDPAASCGWCRYLSCWPTASNNRCKGTGLTTTTRTITTTVPANGSSNQSGLIVILPILSRLVWEQLSFRWMAKNKVTNKLEI